MNNQRFLAIDVLRGMTICFMIIVNTPGNGPTTWAPLLHAKWNGFTPTDLVFPTFMFVVGNALVFSAKKWEGLSESKVIAGILKRSFLIFLLGFLMYWFPFWTWKGTELVPKSFSHTRIMGVLQRIALGYLVGALMIRYLKLSTVLIWSVILLLLYWLILLMYGEPNEPYSMLLNAGTKLDIRLFGFDHLYHGEGVPFDPEGLLSTLPAIANVTFGYAAGKWVQQNGKTFEGLTKLLLVGCVAVVLALAWNPFFPINKKLWTGSFVLVTTGIDCIMLAALIYITDFLQRTRWTWFFQVFGKNPLFIYLLSELGAILLGFIHVGPTHQPLHTWIYLNIFSHAGAYVGSFLYAVVFMLFCWLVGYFLDKKKIYVRV